MTRRFWIGLALAMPVFVLEMGGHFLDLACRLVPPQTSNWIQFALATPGRAVGGLAVFRARLGVDRHSQSQHVHPDRAWARASLGVYSVVATLAPDLFPAGVPRQDGTVAVYFEAAAVITVLVLLGQVLELRAREQTGGAIRALLDLAPKTARRIAADGADEDVPLDRVAVGDRLRVRPGDGVPVDGEVLEGRGSQWTNRWSPANRCR